MSTQNEVSAVTALIKAYGEALSSGNAKAIGEFYTADGAILPDGYKTVQKKQLDQISGKFLKNTNFKINYQTENVAINGEYAIVESVAATSSSPSNNKPVNKTTRDLFILRKTEGSWKIYRYIFNNTK
jgi:uncharacterized protein (TIGR02246 family)